MVDDRRYILEFQGAYRFLSNFWVNSDGLSAEHEYQAAKAATFDEFVYVMDAETPGEAKRRGRSITMMDNWEHVKVFVMTTIVRAKFRDPVLRSWLDSTGDAVLVEGNSWGDTFWGVDSFTGEGENYLGQILMQVRKENRSE